MQQLHSPDFLSAVEKISKNLNKHFVGALVACGLLFADLIGALAIKDLNAAVFSSEIVEHWAPIVVFFYGMVCLLLGYSAYFKLCEMLREKEILQRDQILNLLHSQFITRVMFKNFDKRSPALDTWASPVVLHCIISLGVPLIGLNHSLKYGYFYFSQGQLIPNDLLTLAYSMTSGCTVVFMMWMMKKSKE